MKKYLILGLIITVLGTAPAFAFGKKKKTEIKTNPGMETYVARSIDNLSKNEKPADLVLERAFLNIIRRLYPEDKYTKLAKKVHRICRHPRYSSAKKTRLITKIINKYNEKLDDNQIGYIAAIARLPEKQQKELIENINILSMDGDRYVKLVEQARDNEKQLSKIAYKPDNYDKLKTDIHSKGDEIRSKANAALNFANKARNLVRYAGIIID